MIDAETCWRYLRALRADRPGLAGEGARARTFTAALEQSEQLWTAARDLGHATRPIVLYYCLTQGGQALLAARGRANDWRALPSHGLQPTPPEVATEGMPTLSDFRVHDRGHGFFQQIAALVDSPSLSSDASVSALVNSLPGSEDFFGESDELAPIRVWEDEQLNMPKFLQAGIASAVLSPFPSAMIPESRTLNPSDAAHMPTLDQVHEWLAPYPSLSGENAPTHVLEIIKAHPTIFERFNQLRVGWSEGNGAIDFPARHQTIRRLIDYPFGGVWGEYPLVGHAIPSVGGNSRPMHPLATWWAILYAMSMTARYSPLLWTKVLHPDTSREAERVRHVLDVAVDQVPLLIVLALGKESEPDSD